MSTSWIRTYSGNRFDPLNPDPLMIRLRDIAHALSNTGRFSGHTTEFYSVAQHSVNVATILAQQGESRQVQFEGLMHDASEAYLVDIPRPIKIQPFMAGYREAEKTLELTLARRFNLRYPLCEAVKLADTIALAMEARDLMGDPRDWGVLQGIEKLPWAIIPMTPESAKKQFLAAYADLSES